MCELNNEKNLIKQVSISGSDFFNVDWQALLPILRDSIVSGDLDINASRSSVKLDGSSLLFDISGGSYVNANGVITEGLRIYESGNLHTDEYQSILLFGTGGDLSIQVITRWASAFRTACLSSMAAEVWCAGRKAEIYLSGLGRMGCAAAIVLSQICPGSKITIKNRNSEKFKKYYGILKTVIGSRTSINLVEDLPAEFRNKDVCADSDFVPIIVLASNCRGFSETQEIEDRRFAKYITASNKGPLCIHIGPKYDGDWCGFAELDLATCLVATDSLGQFEMVRKRLTIDCFRPLGLAQLLQKGSVPGQIGYLVSVGAPVVDVAIVDHIVRERNMESSCER